MYVKNPLRNSLLEQILFKMLIYRQEASRQISPEDPKTIFYADVPSPKDQEAIDQLEPQSLASFTTGAPVPAWKDPYYDGRRSYYSTLQDNAILPIA